jgi:NAD(P)-dependent dehydrogenase (short-subunit alcohol dehydrogenase family)
VTATTGNDNGTEMRFDGRVAVVTGAGNGLGRAYALALAARGAAVVVNDIGISLGGDSASRRPANAVVDEIVAAGGRAAPSYGDVSKASGGQQIVATALAEFGRVDILINNAGVLDTAAFVSSSEESVERVVKTHLLGAFNVTRPALKAMLDQGYGRIVSTSSGAVFGSKEGVAYQAAKSGLIAFTRAVGQIGAGSGVRSNAVLPTAFTRMTSDISDVGFRDFMASRFTPERVAAAVLVLAHESLDVSGECFLAGGGRMARLFLGVTQGHISDNASPEEFRDHLSEIMDTEGYLVPSSRVAEFESYLPRMGYGASLSALVGGQEQAKT